MAGRFKIYIVCSDRARNGKTLLARLLADYLLAIGRPVYVFDADSPHGSASRHFPQRSAMIDLERIEGQMRLFDSMLAVPECDYVIDLPARHLTRFFDVIGRIGYVEEADRAGLDIVVMFIVDRSLDSVAAARSILDTHKVEHFFTVRNEGAGNPATDRQVAAAYARLHPHGEIVLAELDRETVSCIEQEGFSFATFLMSEGAHVPVRVRMPLRSFTDRAIAGFRDLQLQLGLDDLRKQGFI